MQQSQGNERILKKKAKLTFEEQKKRKVQGKDSRKRKAKREAKAFDFS